MDTRDIKIIGFDADDTLWVNEKYFREAEESFCELMERFSSKEKTMEVLFDIEMQNLALYGYGVKGFMLSMLETANRITDGKCDGLLVNKIIELGKAMLEKPVILLDQVHEILKILHPEYKLVLVTKGDLLDQERKLKKSGLELFFHHIEIMSEKKKEDYQKLIAHLDIPPNQFMMIGNSLKSDILPVTEIGCHAIYVPYEITWQHEKVEASDHQMSKYHQVEHLREVLNVLM
ncbi:MAG: HAD family hydrolase [Bacteroidota bacterium]